MQTVIRSHFYNLPTVNRARSRPSWDLAEAVKLLHDSNTKFLPLRDLRLEATRASNTAAWPLSSIPPGTTFSEPIPSWKKRKWLSRQRRRGRKVNCQNFLGCDYNTSIKIEQSLVTIYYLPVYFIFQLDVFQTFYSL